MGFDLRTANGNAKVLKPASNYASLFTYLMNGSGGVFHRHPPCAVSNILGNLLGSHFALKRCALYPSHDACGAGAAAGQAHLGRSAVSAGRARGCPLRGSWQNRQVLTEGVCARFPLQKTSRAARRLPDLLWMIFFRWSLIPAPTLCQRRPDQTHRDRRGYR